MARVGTIWAQLAESRPARRLPCFSGIPTRANYRGSEIDAFGGVEERVGQILAGQGIARPLIISAGREYSSPAPICPSLLKTKIQFPAISAASFNRKKWPATTLIHFNLIIIRRCCPHMQTVAYDFALISLHTLCGNNDLK